MNHLTELASSDVVFLFNLPFLAAMIVAWNHALDKCED
jgi:hypothetical protein